MTDFVTLGSALVHAAYLMCKGATEKELTADLALRKWEREYPTCPPQMRDGDGLLTFTPPNPPDAPRRFHQGGMFALTRWTNLYFPMSQVLWGDPIGGPLKDVFGEAIEDIEVYTENSRVADFFAHIKYWDIKCKGGREAPLIIELCKAINLEDVDKIVPAAKAAVPSSAGAPTSPGRETLGGMTGH